MIVFNECDINSFNLFLNTQVEVSVILEKTSNDTAWGLAAVLFDCVLAQCVAGCTVLLLLTYGHCFFIIAPFVVG